MTENEKTNEKNCLPGEKNENDEEWENSEESDQADCEDSDEADDNCSEDMDESGDWDEFDDDYGHEIETLEGWGDFCNLPDDEESIRTITVKELKEKGLPQDVDSSHLFILMENGIYYSYSDVRIRMQVDAKISGDFMEGTEKYRLFPKDVARWLDFHMDMSRVSVEYPRGCLYPYEVVKDYFKNGKPSPAFYRDAEKGWLKTRGSGGLTIRELMKRAKEKVIGQDTALEELCSTIWMYRNTLSYNKNHPECPVPKSNILIQGGSGTGKTFSIQVISEILGLPVIIIDASKLVPTAYRGQKILDSLAIAVKEMADRYTDGDTWKAALKFNEGVILVYDEADKMLAPDDHYPEYNLRAQGDLLKMMEGAEYDLSDSDYLSGDCCVNTKNALFILAGAFARCEMMKQEAMKKEGAGKTDLEKKMELLEWRKESLLQRRDETLRRNEQMKAALERKIYALELEKMENCEKAKATARPQIDLVEELDKKIRAGEELSSKRKRIGFLMDEKKDSLPDEDLPRNMIKARDGHVDELNRLKEKLNNVNYTLDKEIMKCQLEIRNIPEPPEIDELMKVDRQILNLKRKKMEDRQSSDRNTSLPLTVDDLVKYYGIMPEIAGRLQTVCHMKILTPKDLLHILTHSKSSVLVSYQHFFSEQGWKLNFRKNALEALAEEAYRKNTGARGIQAVLNQIIFRTLKDVEGKKDQEIIITKACVTEGLAPEIRSLRKMKETALAANF